MFQVYVNFVEINPIIVTNQILVNLMNNTREDANEILNPWVSNNCIKLNSVTPNPPGRKDTAPIKIEVNPRNADRKKSKSTWNALNDRYIETASKNHEKILHIIPILVDFFEVKLKRLS